jgi:hypothetical protein
VTIATPAKEGEPANVPKTEYLWKLSREELREVVEELQNMLETEDDDDRLVSLTTIRQILSHRNPGVMPVVEDDDDDDDSGTVGG